MDNIIRLKALSSQTALDTWESEGGGLISDPSRGLAARARRPAPVEDGGWQPSKPASWWPNDSLSETPSSNDAASRPIASSVDDVILRSLGAAVIMLWNTIPTKLQAELFDTANSIGELPEADALKGQVFPFLQKHNDDDAE